LEEVIDLVVTQVRVFAVDAIPIRLIGAKSCIEKVKSDFRIDEVVHSAPALGSNSIVFVRGEIKDKKSTLIINRISIEPRKIILEVAGTSIECAQIYSQLVKSMEVATGIDLTKLGSPIVLAETTQCVVKLDFGFDSLLNGSFGEFIYDKVVKAASSDVAKASIRPILAEFEVSYNVKSKPLIDNQVTLVPKRITIGPRVGAPLKERWFFISSPFDSDTHLKLVQDLEKMITNKYPPRVVHGVGKNRAR
jgi:hypothetical protein